MAQHNINKKQKLKFSLIYGGKYHDRFLKRGDIIDAKNLQPFITDEIKGLIAPVNYISISKKEATGYSAETLPIVCEIYLNAKKEGCLTPNQVVIAELSEVLLRTLSRVGIIGLVDEATGYQQVRPADALQAYLDKIIGKELTLAQGFGWKRFIDMVDATHPKRETALLMEAA
jgi:hypothetical protein